MRRLYYIEIITKEKDGLKRAFLMDENDDIKVWDSNDAAERWLNINAKGSPKSTLFQINRIYRAKQ